MKGSPLHRKNCNRWVRTKNGGRVRCGKTKTKIDCIDHMTGIKR